MLFTVLPGCRPVEPEFSGEDVAAIRAAMDTYVQHALAGDWDAWGTILAADIVYMPPNQAPLIGREAAVGFGKSFPKITSLTSTPEEIEGRGDLAYLRGKYSYSATLPDGQNLTESGTYLALHRRQADGAWPFTHLIWHSDSQPATPMVPEVAPSAAAGPSP
jgi:ketosteroid isomerase-like protein